MSEPLRESEWNGMLLMAPDVIVTCPALRRDWIDAVASERNAPAAPRSGKKRGAPKSIGMECQNLSLRPNEMSELLTAPGGNGMLPIASEGNAASSHPLGAEWDAPRSFGMKCQNPSLRPNEMSELLTAPE
jgi:hypothetical protein